MIPTMTALFMEPSSLHVCPSRHALAAVTSPVALVASPAFTSPLTVASSTASAVRLNFGDEDGVHHPPINVNQGKQRCPPVTMPVCPSSQNPLQAWLLLIGVAIFSGSCRGQPRVTCASKHSAIHLYAVSIVPNHPSVLLDLWKLPTVTCDTPQ